jgi:hypothetical protein
VMSERFGQGIADLRGPLDPNRVDSGGRGGVIKA